METVTQFSDRLNEKKFMHRGEDDVEEAREYGVSFVTILHELQKTYNWKRNFGDQKKAKIKAMTSVADSKKTNDIPSKHIQKKIKPIDDESTTQSKHSHYLKEKRKEHLNAKKPIQNERIKEKREFTKSLLKKKKEKTLSF